MATRDTRQGRSSNSATTASTAPPELTNEQSQCEVDSATEASAVASDGDSSLHSKSSGELPPARDAVKHRRAVFATEKDFLETVMLKLSLSDVCDFIENGPALRGAQIVAVSGHWQRVGFIVHRFVMLRLRRPNHKDIWMRLDRNAADGTSLLKFMATNGTTEANDQACLAADPSRLSRGASCELFRALPHLPNLSEFVRFLRIIVSEMKIFRIWRVRPLIIALLLIIFAVE
ncbi:hypothetical protein DL93DRAFT_244463 [Clavulina sp. PMI_390]|nr:hypothetical protein DL93DRAFT_244463 [Clavulina sp. PMI_390]